MAKQRKPDRPGSQLPREHRPLRRGLSFSFQFFINRPPFELNLSGVGYTLTLLERLRDLGGMTAQQLMSARHSALRCHPIIWSDTTQPNGFHHINEAIREQLTPYQFSLSGNAHGRVHGFFIGDVFYVVWLDPEHQLYAR